METSANYNPDGTLNIDYYRNATIDIIEREAEREGINPAKMTANDLRAYLREAYHSIFEPKPGERGRYQNEKCNIYPYTEDKLKSLLDLYIDICARYRSIASMAGFGYYTGIDDETLTKYVTSAPFAISKARKNNIQNALSNTTVGQITLANNDADTGLMYTAQNMIQSEQIKQGLSVSDLYKLPSRQVAQKE